MNFMRNLSLIILLFIFGLGLNTNEVMAKSEWDQEHVSIEKSWEVNFNTAMDPSTLNSKNIYILNKEGEKLSNLEVQTGNNHYKVYIKNKAFYDFASEYQLHITEGVTSEEGVSINSEIVMEFKTESEYLAKLRSQTFTVGSSPAPNTLRFAKIDKVIQTEKWREAETTHNYENMYAFTPYINEFHSDRDDEEGIPPFLRVMIRIYKEELVFLDEITIESEKGTIDIPFDPQSHRRREYIEHTDTQGFIETVDVMVADTEKLTEVFSTNSDVTIRFNNRYEYILTEREMKGIKVILDYYNLIK